MAKLSANGDEVVRYVKEFEPSEYNRGSWTYLSVRSNGRVLRKHVARITDVFAPEGFRRVDYGWKQYQRFPKGVPELAKLDKLYIENGGYSRVE